MRRDTTELAVSELQHMSVQQESVELERNNAHLSSELEGDAPWTIHGIAIGEGDVTRGQSGIRKKWPREALKPAVDSLEGRSLVEDHDNSSRGVVGEVISTTYKDGVGVLYEAELYDEELAERVKNGLLEVSIRGYHGDVENMEEAENGAKLVQRVKFDNLSIVPSGAAPSNTAEMGPSSELSAAECAQMMGVDVDGDELQEFKEGDFVLAGLNDSVMNNEENPTPARIEEVVYDGTIENQNISNNQPVSGTEQNPAALLRVYEYSEGEWQPTETLMAKRFSALQEWDSAEQSSYDVPEGAEFDGNPHKYDEEPERYPEEGDTPDEDRQGMHEYEEEERASEADEMNVEELADYSMHTPEWDGEHTDEWNNPNLEDFASEYDFEAGTDFGELDEDTRNAIGNHFLIARGGFPPESYGDLKLPVVEPDGELSLNALSAVKGGRGATAVDGLSSEMESRIMQWVNETASEVFDKDWGEEEAAEAPEFSEGQMVEWQVNPAMFGKIVHIDDEKDIVMVEVHEMQDGEPVSTGFTVTAGYSDLQMHGGSEQMAEHGEVPEDHRFASKDDAMAFVEDTDGLTGVHQMEFDGETMWVPGDTHEEYMDVVASTSKHRDEEEDEDDEEEMSDTPADDADSTADAGDEAGENDDSVTVLSADRSIDVVSDNDGTGNEPATIVAADNTGDSTMTDEITQDELEELRRKADAYDELEEGDEGGADPSEAVEELREEFQSDLEELKERTAILDEVDRSDVEALQETDEPHIMESEKYEQLEEDVESVRSLYAEALSERTGVPAERIQDKWTLEEMREDLEDELEEGEELEGELTPDPQGADPDEEELEEAAEVEAGEGDSTSEEASEKQEEIRQRILE